MLRPIVFFAFFLLLPFFTLDLFAQNIFEEKAYRIPSSKKGVFYEKGIFHNGPVNVSSTLKKFRHNYKEGLDVERLVFDFNTRKVPRIYSYASGKKTLHIDFLGTNFDRDIENLNQTMNFVSSFDFYILDGNTSLQMNLKENVSFDVFYLEKEGSTARLVIDMKRI